VATEEDLFCLDVLSALTEAMPNLDVVTTVERPTAGWTGAMGQVTDHLDPIDPMRSYYLCGPPGMVGAADELLRRHDVPRDLIHVERFLETGDEQQ
jgi:methane monooxygenase component C